MSNLFDLPALSPRVYSLFISHAWGHTAEYDGLVSLIRPDFEFSWKNLSVPKTNPIQTLLELRKPYRYLVKQLDEAINKADCLLVLAGMYAAHSGWIQSEIEAAKEFGVPIIAIRPFGSERLPEAATHAAVEEVGWNRKSVISAIRRHAGQPRRPSNLFGF